MKSRDGDRQRIWPVEFTAEEIEANHAALLARNAVHQGFGFDPDASVQFVLDKALPLEGCVLDIGTGKGRFAIQLARRVAQLVTVDINADEQRCAKLEAIYNGVHDRIRFVLADAQRLPWPDASFGAVTSWNAFHHLSDPERVMDEMCRVLKPGGKLVLADFSESGFALMDAIHKAEGRTHPHPPSRFSDFRKRLSTNGFSVEIAEGQHEEVLIARRSPLPNSHPPSARKQGEVRLGRQNAAEP
ncbi:MAG: class I SAM-dependent methyltransferase [Verrucomicrobiota bacterium]|nr:class I SAM-dependent methyltransferase [Verrucomicrobiota bacterium]